MDEGGGAGDGFGIDPALIEPASPMQRLLGFALTGWSEDRARVEMPLTPQMMNRQGIPHGGIHAVLLDSAMGWCGCYTGDPERRQMVLTLSLTTDFVAQARGARLVAEARRVGGGRRTFFAEGTVRDDSGTLVARGSGVFRYRGTGKGGA